MKRMKRILSLLLATVLVLGTITVSSATSTPEREKKAKALYAMGLFKGYDETGTNFGLNDKVTREQALILLIRMLGEDSKALAWTGANPYGDVPTKNWAKPYIGYGKEKGYTVGLGNNKFGLGQDAKMQEMVVFALRGLGYSDAAGVNDFNWNNSLSFAKSKGIIESDKAVTPFTRGVAVDILFGALAANVKGQDYDLLSKLMNQGVVTQAQYDKAIAIMGETTKDTANNLASGTYTMGCMGKYIRVNSGKLEIRDTTPAQQFTVTNKGDYSYIKTDDGKYVALASNLKDGTPLTTSTSSYSWVIEKQSGSNYTIRPYEKQAMVVNASEEKSANGTQIIVWTHSGAPKNTLITMTYATGKAVTGISLDQTTATVEVGKTKQLTGTITPSTATNKGVTWSSSNTSVATVDSNGVVKGIKAGTATITVKTVDGGKTATCKVTVGTNNVSADTQKLIDRFNKTVEAYNNRVDKFNKSGLASDAALVKSMNEVTASINAMAKELDKATSLTAAQIKEYNTALDAVDALVKQLDTLLNSNPGAPDTTAASKALTKRYNDTVNKWNTMVDKIDNSSLAENTKFVKDMGLIADGLNAMSKVIGEGTGIYTQQQIDGYNTDLNAIDALIKDLNALLEAEANKSKSTTAPITIANKTGVDLASLAMSPSKQTDWSGNLGGINAGVSGVSSITFNSDTLLWDMKATDKNGESLEFYGIDFSGCTSKGGTITLTFNASKGEGTATYKWN